METHGGPPSIDASHGDLFLYMAWPVDRARGSAPANESCHHRLLQQSRVVCERKLFRIMESVILWPVMVIFLVAGQLVPIGRGANILYISSVASPSHFLWLVGAEGSVGVP